MPEPPEPNAARRWPVSVYGSGEEPDPRFSLANERTFLAWIRTTLALLAGAAAIEGLDLSLPGQVTSGVAILLAVAGLVTATQAWRGWARTERALRHGRPLPSGGIGLFVAVVVGVVAVALLVTTTARLG